MNNPDLAVTGATGAIGGGIARLLADQGISQRLVVRDPARAPSLEGAPVARASYGDVAATAEALAGVRTLFMVSGKESATRSEEHRAFIEGASRAGVEHIVYTSFLGAAPDATFTHARDHYEAEQQIKASGMRWTLLRDNFYQDLLPEFVGEDDVLRGPAGDGRCTFVTRDDVARVAATVLANPTAHQDRTYNLTGPEALSLTDVAEQLSEATNRSVQFHNESIDEAYESRRTCPPSSGSTTPGSPPTPPSQQVNWACSATTSGPSPASLLAPSETSCTTLRLTRSAGSDPFRHHGGKL